MSKKDKKQSLEVEEVDLSKEQVKGLQERGIKALLEAGIIKVVKINGIQYGYFVDSSKSDK